MFFQCVVLEKETAVFRTKSKFPGRFCFEDCHVFFFPRKEELFAFIGSDLKAGFPSSFQYPFSGENSLAVSLRVVFLHGTNYPPEKLSIPTPPTPRWGPLDPNFVSLEGSVSGTLPGNSRET